VPADSASSTDFLLSDCSGDSAIDSEGTVSETADAVGVGPHVSERRGVTAWSGRRRGGGRTGRARPQVRSAAVLRREPGFAMEEWWRGTGEGRGSWG
jgi:hypothetical protein